MRTSLVSLALAGTLGLTGTALLAPTLASAQSASPTATPSAGGVSERVTALKDALAGLVQDDTITQAQADRVAATLAERLPARDAHGGAGGHGGPGRHGARISPEATAAVLGITVDELRTERTAGRTLAQIATAEGVSRTALVQGLVAAAERELAADVAAGEITQARADALAVGLTARVTAKVDQVGREGREGRGHR